jgi:hypothetical protein
VDWIQLALDSFQKQIIVNTIMKLQILFKKVGNFMTFRFSINILPHIVGSLASN